MSTTMTDNILTEKEFPDDNEAVAAPTDEDHEAALQNVALTSDEENEDEGGLRAWLSVAGSFLVYFASFGIVNSFGFFQTYYQLNYLSGYPASEIAFIGTLQITLMYLSGSVAGALFDIYGLKYMYPFAALGGSGSLLALSFTKPNHIWQQFVSQSLLLGLTIAFGVQPALTVVGQYFTRRRALAMGIVAGGSSVGGVCLPIMFSHLIPEIGFPWAMRVGALILLFCYAVAMCISRAKYQPRKLRSLACLLDYGGYKDIRYATLSIGTFVFSLGLYVPYYYIQPFCATLDPNTNVQSYLLPLINALSFVGRIIGGQLADQFGRLNLLYPMIITSGVLCFVMWLPARHPSLIVAFACLYGLCSGVFISVMPAATGQITPKEKLGARLGAFGTLTALAFLIGTPIAGALIQEETRVGYRPLILFAACTLLGGGIIIFISRLIHDRNLRSKW